MVGAWVSPRATTTTTAGRTFISAITAATHCIATTVMARSPTSRNPRGLEIPGGAPAPPFADYDGDGWLDLYVANYVVFDHKNPPAPDCQYRGIRVHCGPKGLLPAADVLYHNNGDGTFTDATRAAGMAVAPAYGLGAVWCDFDNDGDADL